MQSRNIVWTIGGIERRLRLAGSEATGASWALHGYRNSSMIHPDSVRFDVFGWRMIRTRCTIAMSLSE